MFRDKASGAFVLLACAHVIAAIAIVASGEARASDDFSRYFEIGSAPGRPYVSFQVEHAPLTVGLFRVLAWSTGNRATFGNAMVAIDLTADLAIAALLAWAFDRAAAGVYLAITLALLAVLDTRFDFLPTAAATLAIAASVRKKPATAMLALTLGAGFKLWPLCLAGLVVRREEGSARRRASVALLSALMVFAGVWLAIGGVQGVMQVLTFRGATGWQIESIVGLALAFRNIQSVRFEAGAFRIGHVSPIASILMLALAAATALAIAWRAAGRESHRIGAAWLASVAGLLIFSPLLSPQFLVWLAPAAAIAWIEGDRAPAILTATATAVTAIYMTVHSFVIAGHIWALSMVVVRNALLLSVFVLAVRAVFGAGHRLARGRQ